MLLGQTKELVDVTNRSIDSAGAYGLVGYLLIATLIVIVMATAAAARFFAPLIRSFVASTVDLHTSLKENGIKQTAMLDSISSDHGSKLDNIQSQLGSFHCPMVHSQPPHGV